MYIGIDLGTSGVKVILMAEDGNVVASCSSPLSVSRPFDLWSEQTPEDWWQATDLAMLQWAAENDLRGVKAFGFSGRLNAATFLNKKGVMTADCRDDRPHLMIVGYDPEDITTFELIATAQNRGYHAELIAM